MELSRTKQERNSALGREKLRLMGEVEERERGEEELSPVPPRPSPPWRAQTQIEGADSEEGGKVLSCSSKGLWPVGAGTMSVLFPA